MKYPAITEFHTLSSELTRWYAGLRPIRLEIDNTFPMKHETVR